MGRVRSMGLGVRVGRVRSVGLGGRDVLGDRREGERRKGVRAGRVRSMGLSVRVGRV